MIDVSRCSYIESFIMLQSCISLVYLDLSYTKITDISPVSNNCVVLKSLNLAGVALDGYQSLGLLESVELLVLRNSTVTDIDFARHLLLLRSLDIGQTDVMSIDAIQSLYRLEELLLDCCTKLLPPTAASQDGESSNRSVEVISDLQVTRFTDSLLSFQQLHILNVSDIGLPSGWSDSFLCRCSEDIHLESKSRREQLLECLLADDVLNAKRLLQGGLDVNMVAGPWAEAILNAAWRSKGKYASHVAPFFIVNHPDETLRPRLIHVALYFNRQKCTRLLIEYDADLKSQVWLSDVLESKGRVLINEKKVKRPETCIVKTPYLPMECCDRAVYRITEGMVQNNETRWRQLSQDIEKELAELLLGKWLRDEIVLTRPNTAAATATGVPPLDDAPDGFVAETSSVGEVMSIHEEGEDDGRRESIVSGLSLDSASISSDAPTAAKKPKGTVKSNVSPKPDRPDWRTHVMVSKLVGAPIVLKSSVSRKSVSALGKKSYWLESKAWHGQAVAQREQQLEQMTLEFRQREQDEIKERRKVVSLKPLSEEDQLVRASRSRYDYPVNPATHEFALPGQALRTPIPDRRQEMRRLLNKKLGVDIVDK